MICEGILKVLMVIFNSVIFISGAVTVGIGFLVNIGKSGFEMLNNIEGLDPRLKNLASIGYLLIAVGAVLAFMGFLGCCGAWCENKCMLGTFFIIILILYILEVVAAVLVLLYRPKMKCCGYNNYTNFTDSPFVSDTSQYPQICCPESPEPCDIGKASSKRVHGCFDALVNLVKNNVSLLGGVAICVAAIEVAVMIVSLILYKK